MRKYGAFLAVLALFSAVIFYPAILPQKVKGQQESKNVILIGWDGVQRNHLFELLNNQSLYNVTLPNLTTFINQGVMVNITVSDHGTDTKAGWTQILTGYRWWKTGVFNNNYWFHAIPQNYTIPERVESYFGRNNVDTAFIVGKLYHMEIQDGTGDTVNGRYTQQAIYKNLPSGIDVCENGDKNASVIGPRVITFLKNHAGNHFFAFFHFSDPDTAGHFQGGENSAAYERAIERCDYWFGQILGNLTSLNIAQNTLVYLTVDHGFDEGGTAHLNAPYITLTTNDKNVIRGGDQIDVAPTVYYGLGMWGKDFNPVLDGYPLQMSLPSEVEQERQNILADVTKASRASITSPTNGASLAGVANIIFNASDTHLCTALLLINNNLIADGPWTWRRNDTVEVNGTYAWDTTNISAGSYNITILAFDEHGANNGPSTSTVTVNKAAPQSPPTPTTNPPTASQQPSTIQPASTPPPNDQPVTPPTAPPPEGPAENPEGSETGFPMAYVHGTVAAMAVMTVFATGYLLSKRKK